MTPLLLTIFSPQDAIQHENLQKDLYRVNQST